MSTEEYSQGDIVIDGFTERKLEVVDTNVIKNRNREDDVYLDCVFVDESEDDELQIRHVDDVKKVS